MDIESIKRAKKAFEKKVASAANKFHQKTGMAVEGKIIDTLTRTPARDSTGKFISADKIAAIANKTKRYDFSVTLKV